MMRPAGRNNNQEDGSNDEDEGAAAESELGGFLLFLLFLCLHRGFVAVGVVRCFGVLGFAFFLFLLLGGLLGGGDVLDEGGCLLLLLLFLGRLVVVVLTRAEPEDVGGDVVGRRGRGLVGVHELDELALSVRGFLRRRRQDVALELAEAHFDLGAHVGADGVGPRGRVVVRQSVDAHGQRALGGENARDLAFVFRRGLAHQGRVVDEAVLGRVVLGFESAEQRFLRSQDLQRRRRLLR
mmetsp:Transcript_4965/g.15594  ORF Transcript_4965/g.15594 Transcript_4965/m.15594 type:complete len:238 (+) Transcript_4965:109-822(+)